MADVMDFFTLKAFLFYMIVITFTLVILTYINTRHNDVTNHIDIDIQNNSLGFFESYWKQPAGSVLKTVTVSCREPFTIALGKVRFSAGTATRTGDIVVATNVKAGADVDSTGMVANEINGSVFTLLPPVYASKMRKVFLSINTTTLVRASGKVRVTLEYFYI